MRPTSTHVDSPAVTAQPNTFCRHAPIHRQTRKCLSKLAVLTTVMTLPLYAQAALPEAIETALSRADLTSANISIVITPVGDKNASRLPAPIQVIDSSYSNSQSTPNSQNNTAADTVIDKNNNQTNTQNNHKKVDVKNNANHQSALAMVEKQTIKQHEQQLHAYTDDAYTYQSLESIPSVVPNKKPPFDTDNGSSQNGNTTNQNGKQSSSSQHTTVASIKTSFSPLLSHQSTIARTPASTMKLVPSFIALDTLGADFVWYTRVYHTGLIIGDRLHGDLIIQGSGDPKMTHERLKQLLYKVKAAGIRHIDGDIIVDSAVFDSVSKDPAAFDNSPLRPYNASPDGFLVNFSTIGIQSYPLDNGQARLTYTPQLANYQLPTTIDTRSAACGQARYSLAPQWQAQQLLLNANLPNSCAEHMFYVAYPNAKDFAARVVAAKWQELGNTLSGTVIPQETPYDLSTSTNTKVSAGLAALPISPLPLASYPSLNLTQQIYDINHFSNNVMTEQVALSIGTYANNNPIKGNNAQINAAETGEPNTSPSHTDANNKVVTQDKKTDKKMMSLYQFGQPAITNYPTALQTINQWWQTTLSTPPPHLTNGSGLCRDCTITAENLNELLTYAYHHPSFDAYVNSLGIAGVSGTIAAHSERLPESAAIGRAWIKTGTLNDVTSMAGYVKGLSGQDYVVVGIINSEQALNAYTARPVLDAMLDWTAQH